METIYEVRHSETDILYKYFLLRWHADTAIAGDLAGRGYIVPITRTGTEPRCYGEEI